MKIITKIMEYKIKKIKKRYKGFATIKELTIRHEKFDGTYQTINREIYDRGDSVAVLVYNPTKETILLTKQFRSSLAYRGETNPYLIEIVAGLIDKEKTSMEIAKMEVLEEIGYNVNPKYLMSFYVSPGAITEKIHLFSSTVCDEDKIKKGGGVAAENEDIITIEIPFKDIYSLIYNGQIIDAKTIIALLHIMNVWGINMELYKN